MVHTMRHARRALCLASLLLGAGTAAAAPGDHIRTGDTTLAPNIDLGMEYRTNVYRAASDPTSGVNLRLAPGLDMGIESTENRFTLGGEWEIRKYLFLAVDPANRAAQIAAADRFNDFNFSARLDALRQESVGLVVSDQVTLRNSEVDRGIFANPYTTQVRNTFYTGMRISPGHAFDFVPGGQWSYDDFRVADTSAVRTRFNSRNTFGPTVDISWRFFPRTGFVLRSSGMWNQWSQNAVDVSDPVSGVLGTIEVPNSFHVKVLGGIEGRFTERLFLDALFGYGNALYDPSAAIDETVADLKGATGLIGSFQARYKMVREGESSLEGGVGFKRDFTDSFFTNYVAYNQIHAQLSARVADLIPRARYSIRLQQYQGVITRNDVLNRFDAGLGYAFNAWGQVSGGFYWQQLGVREAAFQDVEYDEFVVRLLTTFTY